MTGADGMRRLEQAFRTLIEGAIDRRVAEPLRRLAASLPAPAPDAAGPGLGPWQYRGHPDQPFGAVSYAQFGEDLVLVNLFHDLGVERPSFLDIGAHHPVNCSNTALLYARGSRGVNIEANPNLIPAFTEMRPEDLTLNLGVGPAPGRLDFYMIDEWSGRNTFDAATARSFVAAHPEFAIREVRQIEVVTLEEVLQRHCDGRWPDLLSIDVEGLDLPILQGSSFDRSNGPRIICAEVLSGDDRSQAGGLSAVMRSKGYRQVFRTAGNAIFLADSGSTGQ
jgi:FkbM family methyltransferase